MLVVNPDPTYLQEQHTRVLPVIGSWRSRGSPAPGNYTGHGGHAPHHGSNSSNGGGQGGSHGGSFRGKPKKGGRHHGGNHGARRGDGPASSGGDAAGAEEVH